MYVYFDTDHYPNDPVRAALPAVAAAHWKSLGVTVHRHFSGPDQRMRFIKALTAKRYGTTKHDPIVVSDDDILLRPYAMKFRHKAPVETWEQHVRRLFAENEQIGMLCPLPVPEFPCIEPNQNNFVWRLPEDQREVWSERAKQSGNQAMGGIRFFRPGVLTDDIPEGNDKDYDYILCDWLREQGWVIGYMPCLHAHHLGHGLSVVRKSDDIQQALATTYRSA